ncbi:MAG: hypothetical protein R2789_14400 [Microthrixaceae bacterium]
MARRQPAVTPLTVVLTDGNPTYHNSGNGVNGHGNSLGGNGGLTSTADVNKAVQEADLPARCREPHPRSRDRKQPEHREPGGDLRGGTPDRYQRRELLRGRLDNRRVHPALQGLLEDFTKELCAPSLNITKTEIPLRVPNALRRLVPDLELESARRSGRTRSSKLD